MFKRLKEGFKKFLSNITAPKEEKYKKPGLFKLKIQEKHLKLEELRRMLLKNDIAFEVTEIILDELKKRLINKEISRKELRDVIKKELGSIIKSFFVENTFDLLKIQEKPFVILFLGFNGCGKTTTIAKLAYYFKTQGKSVVLAAGDTFRAAGIEQLETHAKRLGIKVVKHRYGADPAAVVFDAIKYAKANGVDYVLCDTAGRSHANTNLMDELKKIVRVNKPHLKILVLDALTGNDVVEQAKRFDESVGVDAMIFAKADVYEKGAIISAAATIKKPILFLGTGQDYKDLKAFDVEEVLNLIGLNF